MSARRREFRVTGRHVLAGGVLFFGAVIGVDAAFTVLAFRSHPGETSPTAYEDGLAYNRTLEARAAQAELGWTATVEAGAPGVVSVRIADASGRPLEGLKVSGILRRPATDAGVQAVTFRPDGAGGYRAQAALDRGGWDLTLLAQDAQGRALQTERRLLWR